ncbi:interferon lambda receptor 1 isoform X1 [Pezoporus wallicus]|uniref:interferon lambda receptor 1 isoform X1 n=1 Tax=Pezoporus wallicus TaxID=35540 RepID=UPI00255006A5|nr:interferon lambda receptor 1 isoform X1 [Pezoporus wallicus]
MCTWGAGMLLALCLLRQARGRGQLPPPQNVTLLSKDFDMILTWAPGEGSPPDMTYTVRYESQERLGKWMKVPHCKNTHRTSCNLTCVLPSLFVKVRARVKAVSGQLRSPWAESQFKEYYLDVELAPPELHVKVKENKLHVNASFPLATCVESISWMYDLNLWEAGSDDKKQYEGIFRKNTVSIDATALRGNYCLSARSSFQNIDFKHSKFSRPVCVLLNHKAVEWKFLFSATIPVFVLPIFLTSAFITCLLTQDVKGKKMPHALDFSQLKAAGPAFHCEFSKEEFFRDCLICTEKPISQRKTNNTSGRNNLPWVASSPSSTSSLSSSSSSSSSLSSLEKEEEEEDSSTFTPYTEMQFPNRHLNCQASRTAQGESSLDSRSRGLSMDSESLLDLSTLGFSFFPIRTNEVDTSGSQGNERVSLSHSSSLGRISLTDVRFPGPREQGQQDTARDECLGTAPLQTLMKGACFSLPGGEHCLHRQGHHSPGCFQQPESDLQARLGEISWLSVDPSMELLVSLQTLQVAEDEGIASDCDSESFMEGTVLRDPSETSNMEEKYDHKFKFKGYEHTHYTGRR